MKKIIFQIDGGIGKSIMATAVCEAIKKQYPRAQLIVITGYTEVFLCNPFVDKVFNHNNLAYFYEEHIEGLQPGELLTLLHNPYLETDFVLGHKHLIELWCNMFGIRYNGERPQIFITDRERSNYINQFGQSAKPIMVVQTNGGAANQGNKYSWARDIPNGVAQQVVNAFANEYNIIHLRREDQLALQNTTPLQADFRAVCVLISISALGLYMDSFAQHAAAALGKPGVVLWIGNSPQQFGYALHNNIIAAPPTLKPELRHSVYTRYNISGSPTEFPYRHEGELFDPAVIVNALRYNNEEIPGVSKVKNNFVIAEKIGKALGSGSMVAKRLAHLAGVIDLADIRHILDIGSRDLGQSVEFANIFNYARIDAFEPVPASYAFCQQTLNSLDVQKKSRVFVHNLALTSEDGTLPFYEVDATQSSVPNVGASSMFKFIDGLNGTPFGQQLIQKEIEVQGSTLDTWCATNSVKQVDIMWVDAQGSELLVFKGGEQILKNTRIIMTEVGLKPYYEGHTLKDDIDKYLGSLGFFELKSAFELNGFDYEANTIYVRA